MYVKGYVEWDNDDDDDDVDDDDWERGSSVFNVTIIGNCQITRILQYNVDVQFS